VNIDLKVIQNTIDEIIFYHADVMMALKISSGIDGHENGKERHWDNTNIVYE